MKKLVIAFIIGMLGLVCFAHSQKKTETINWRCAQCRTHFKRTSRYVWKDWGYTNGWFLEFQTPCPQCGFRDKYWWER